MANEPLYGNNPSCCGKRRESNFCPVCGNELPSGPLVSLIAHIKSVIESYNLSISFTERYIELHGSQIGQHQKHILRERKLLEKWITWLNALQEVVYGNQSRD